MKKTTNAKSREYTNRLEPFKAHNLRAERKGNHYVVYSYNWWPLFAYSFEQNRWYENEERYSVSTSKQRGQCHPGCDTIKLSHEALKELISK